MRYFLGIDGGGTKTKAIIINEHFDVVFEGKSGPSSIDTVDSETTIKNIVLSIQNFVDANPNITFTAVFIGLGGIVFESDYIKVENLVRRLPQVDENTIVRARNDMYNALYSSNQFHEGIALICGTGMVAFGLKDHKQHKAGGWGYKEGELGSGYHLGREAIRHTTRAYDGRLRKTAFAKEIAQTIDFNNSTDIFSTMENFYSNRTLTASLAPIVIKHANLNNPYAKQICRMATKELALAIRAVYKKLNFTEVTLVVVGSLGNAPGYFKEQLHLEIKKIDSGISIIEPVIDPALAAAKAAKYLSEGLL
jgi:N-acetylglucosamine kinase-like BadF-type ATPase